MSHFTVFYGIYQPVTGDEIIEMDGSLTWMPIFIQESREERRLALEQKEQEIQNWSPGFRFHPLCRAAALAGLVCYQTQSDRETYLLFIGRFVACTGGKPGESAALNAISDADLVSIMQQVKDALHLMERTEPPMLYTVYNLGSSAY